MDCLQRNGNICFIYGSAENCPGPDVCPSGYVRGQDGQIVAVLSTTVLPLDGTYMVDTVTDIPDITGVPHYIGHPSTRDIVESLGAVPADTKLFPGLKPGQKAICFPITQGKSSRAVDGKTVDQDVSFEELTVRVITRLDDGRKCPICGTPVIGNYCAGCGVG